MMEKQQEQMKQNPNQEIKYTSGFLNEDEEVNESEFDESIREKEASKLVDNQQKNPEGEEQLKKVKRPRKTIEQEIAELDAKRERLMDKKRRQEAHEKIVFGGTIIAMLKDMKEKNDKNYLIIYKTILLFAENEQKNNYEIINKIIKSI